MTLRLEQVSVTLDGARVLGGVELEVHEGETMAVLGPSGAGKSTLLRVVAGLQRVDSGSVTLGGRDITTKAPHTRGIGLMFQDDALFPHRDVAGNVAFGLRMAGAPRSETQRRVEEMLDLVGLPGFAARSVAQLSGGEKQRVALARALAPGPRVLLLDEPLSSLDPPLHARLVADLREMFDALDLTIVYVTHDVGEAFAVGRRIAVMHEGRIVRVAEPDALWAHPRDEWVARFLGMRNVRDRDGTAIVIRPEAVAVRADPGGDAVVVSAERRGPVVDLRLEQPDGQVLDVVLAALDHPRPGERVVVTVDPAGVIELPAQGR